MELFKAIFLGALQGLTEFLPVSSSGHLVIASELLDFKEQGVVFDVCLHVGTLLAVVIVFRKELLEMIRAPFAYLFAGDRSAETVHAWRWDLYVILATLPAVVVGLFFKDYIEALFSDTLVAYCMLLVTVALMLTTKMLQQRDESLNWWRAVVVGCAQACAILPGLSRSGSTIFAGMAVGVDREKIARFSFIMSIPAIVGAAVLQIGEFVQHPPQGQQLLGLGAGAAAAAVFGWFAIWLLLDMIRKNRLQWFGYYCLVLAATGLAHRFFFSV